MTNSMAKRAAAGTLALAVCLGGGALCLAGSANAETPTEPASDYDATSVVITSGDAAHLADSVTAGPFAALQDANILLTPSASLDAGVTTYLKTTRPDVAYIIGGPTAVSDDDAAAIATADPGVHIYRVYGADRYATATAVAQLADKQRAYFGGTLGAGK